MSAPNALQSTAKLYKGVMEEVVSSVKEAFLDEGVDEAILQELKQIWENKVLATKVIETLNPQHVPQSTRNTQQQQQHHHAATASAVANHMSQTVQHAEQQTQHYGMNVNHGNLPVPVIQQAVPAGIIAAHQLATTMGNARLHPSVITNAQGSLFMQLPTQGNVRFLGGPQIPTIAAGSSMMPSAMAGLIPQKREKPPVPGVTVVPQQLDGPSGSRRQSKVVVQLDGPGGISDDEDDIEEDDLVHDEEEEPVEIPGPVEEGEPLNSEDDESVENEDEMFEADDVIVCQFEKVNRIRNKWKFVLKDGVINLGRKDYVFNRATGEAEF